jgi:protein-disulfide isomerase
MAMLKVPVTSDDHVSGPADAPVTLVEYGDYECPHCGTGRRIPSSTWCAGNSPRTSDSYSDFFYEYGPPEAESAAETAEFAGAIGLFWEMHDALYEN